MILRILLVILTLGVLPVYPQAIVEDGKLTITPNWEPNDTKTYIRDSYAFLKEDDEYKNEPDSSKMEIIMKVMNKTPDNYMVEAKRNFLDENNEEGIQAKLFDAMNGTRFTYSMSSEGSFMEITNKDAILALIRNTMIENWEMLDLKHPRTGNDIDNEVQARNMLKMQFSRMGDRMWVQYQMDVPYMIYHAFYNEKLNMEGETIKRDTVKDREQNEHIMKNVYKVEDMDAINNVATISLNASYTEKTLGSYFAMPVYRQIQSTRRLKELPETKVDISVNYKVDLATGWVKEYEYTIDSYVEDFHHKRNAKMVMQEK